ncbi:MAG: ATP-binding cassette domain-containing protein [Pseudobdellovibrionaceae bacterium]
MNLLQLHQGSKQYGPKILFDKAAFSVNDGEHIGVIGPNGAGKTTLFKILVGQEHLDSGDLIMAQKLRIGYLEQESEWPLDVTSEEYLAQNCTVPLWELKQLGQDLGLTETHFASPLKNLSGGYRMRMKLLGLIGQEPNLMLLDEPTNFLDLESVLALEKFLQSYQGAFLLISHDREFLKRTTESTLEVEQGDITKFPGTIDDYFEQKTQLRQILEAQVANQESKRKSVMDFVDRFGAKATKARQAQSRLKQLEKMEKIEIKDLPVKAKIHIPSPLHTGKEVLTLEKANLGYGDKAILSNVNLRLERGQHLGVVGFNGAGKSTLLKSLGDRIPLLSGYRALGYQVSYSYFAQHVTEDLDLKDTVLSALQSKAHPDIKAQEILNLAGSLLFSGDAVYKKISVLSGGEKTRVALGQILLRKSPLLLMDEPTNHLDFETVEALTEALKSYDGTVVVVSHDRSFIGRVANKILEIRDGKVEMYPGTYDEYVWSLEKGALSQRVSLNETDSDKNTPSKIEIEAPKVNYKDENKRLQSLVKELNRKILKTEEILSSLHQKTEDLNKTLLISQGQQAQQIAKELSVFSKEIEQTEENLLVHMENLEKAERDLQTLKET